MAKHKKHNRHRNAASLAAVRRSRATNKPDDEDEIDVGTILAALGGGVGGAFAGGWLASRGWTEEAVSAVMAVGGGVAAAFTDGPARVASMGIAAAGAGQFALTLFDDPEEKKIRKAAEAMAKKIIAEKEAESKLSAAAGTPAGDKPKLANAASPYGTEAAFNRARARLAALHDEEGSERYADA
jgi:fructose 1,6-bisphosphatase